MPATKPAPETLLGIANARQLLHDLLDQVDSAQANLAAAQDRLFQTSTRAHNLKVQIRALATALTIMGLADSDTRRALHLPL